jgi:hypothetical protein
MEESTKPVPARPAAKRSAAKQQIAKKKPAPASGKTASTGEKTKKSARPKPAKPKKPKLVRDSFTIPKDEYEVLAVLKQRCVAQAHPSKKSELLRAGIKALAAMSDKGLLAALQAVPSIKTGRPKKA